MLARDDIQRRIKQLNHKSFLQVLGALLRLGDPLLQLGLVPGPDLHLERLGVERQRRRRVVAVEAVHDGAVGRVVGLREVEGGDDADVGRVQLAVGEVRARAHARARAVGVVRRADLGVVEEALDDELVRHLEAVLVVVGSVGILIPRLLALFST